MAHINSTSSSRSLSTLTAIPVAYDPRMLAPPKRISPSSAKPAPVVASWRRLGVPLLDVPVTPVTREELALAHEPRFVDDVLACRHANGFGDYDPAVAASLPFTSGAMLSAARHVLATGSPVAAAPCSGFHHAGWGRAGGFCTFNGLMVTALALHRDGRVRRLGILDCDMHYGDGTEDILERVGARVGDGGWLTHYTTGAFDLDASVADAFIERHLPKIADAMADCDLVLYQAGADPHINDPLGGWMTTEQLSRRDARVFELFAERGVPVVWNLAGGYQVEPDGSIPKVLEIHDNTMRACADRYLGAGLR
jgi:acetoin utilization deacetylase AcuC-like enzyme